MDVYGRRTPAARLRKKLAEKPAELWHSTSYHRFFEDYTEYEKTDVKGRRRIVREYTGPVYEPEFSTAEGIAVKTACVLLYGSSLLGFVGAGIQTASETTAWYLAVCELMTLLFFSLLAYTLVVDLVFAPKKLTTNAWREITQTLTFRGRALAVCISADLCSFGINKIFSHGKAERQDGKTVLYFGISLLCMALLLIVKKRIRYEEKSGQAA